MPTAALYYFNAT